MTVYAHNVVMLAKTEAAYNDFVTVPTSNILLASSFTYLPLEANTANRKLLRQFMGNEDHALAVPRSRMQAELVMAGSGTKDQPPRWRHLMRACGMRETINAGTSVTYAPVSTGFESLATAYYLDNILHLMGGARGTWSVDFKAGEMPMLKTDIQGLRHNSTIDTHNFTPDYSGWGDLAPFNSVFTSALTFFGVTPAFSAFNYTHNNTIAVRDIPNHKEVMITGRAPTASITLELPSTLTMDFVDAAMRGLKGSLSFQQGQFDGNEIVVYLPNVQLMPDPKYSVEDDVAMVTFNLKPLPTVGDDEILITVR
jgi:hypothetical protein